MGVVNTVGGPIFVADSKPAQQTQQMLQLARQKTLQDFRGQQLGLQKRQIGNQEKNQKFIRDKARFESGLKIVNEIGSLKLTDPDAALKRYEAIKNTPFGAEVLKDQDFEGIQGVSPGLVHTETKDGLIFATFRNPDGTLGSKLIQAKEGKSPPSVGAAREGVAQAKYGKNFRDLSGPQKVEVNKTVRQDKIDVAAAGVQQQVISPTTQKDLAGLDTITDAITVIRSNFSKQFLGPIKGTATAFSARRKIGSYINSPVGKRELIFRQTLEGMADVLLRLRSGAQINEQEFVRLRDLLPKADDEIQVYRAGLDRFESEVRRLKIQRLKRSGQTREQAKEEAAGLELPQGTPPPPPGFVLEQ